MFGTRLYCAVQDRGLLLATVNFVILHTVSVCPWVHSSGKTQVVVSKAELAEVVRQQSKYIQHILKRIDTIDATAKIERQINVRSLLVVLMLHVSTPFDCARSSG